MKKFFTNKVMQFVLVFALVVTSLTVFTGVDSAQAATSLLEATSVATAAPTADSVAYLDETVYMTKRLEDGTYYTGYQVTIDTDCIANFYLDNYQSKGSQSVGLLVVDYTGAAVVNTTVTTGKLSDNQYRYGATYSAGLKAGTYSVFFISTTGTSDYISATIYRDKKTTVVAGFAQTLKVDNVTAWSSNKTKIATVKNGKITGKKAGKCTIKATLADGTVISVPVTVVANKYTEKKLNLKNGYGVMGGVKEASYDKNGNLVIKVQIGNATNYTKTVLSGMKVTIKNASGKTIGTLKTSSSFTVAKKKVITKTYTIKKKKLKNKKKQNLTKASATISGKYR